MKARLEPGGETAWEKCSQASEVKLWFRFESEHILYGAYIYK